MTKYLLLASAAGFFIPLQALINARLGSYLTGPLSAALASFAVGMVGLAVFFTFMRLPVPTAAQIAAAPWWAWAGGLVGAFFVTATVISVQKLGAAGMISVVIAAQLLGSLLYDHFGILHAQQPLNLTRILGAGLLMLGVYLIVRPQA